MRTITEYITADTIMPRFLPYPYFLLKMDLSYTARLLYALLLDRSTLSQKNGWQDSEGRTYIVYPVSEITEAMDKGSTTIKSALNELDAAGLLVRERRGFSTPNRLYVKVPTVVQVSDHMTAGKPTLTEPGNRPTDSRETDPLIVGKPTTNQLTINQLKENQLNGASGEPPAPFGRYKNIFLSESDYAELKEEYPDRLERFIEELSEFIAATGREYANHTAAVRMWAKRDRKGTGKKGIPDYTYKEGESL